MRPGILLAAVSLAGASGCGRLHVRQPAFAAVVAAIAAGIATGSTVRHQQPARSNFPQCPKTVD